MESDCAVSKTREKDYAQAQKREKSLSGQFTTINWADMGDKVVRLLEALKGAPVILSLIKKKFIQAIP